MTTTNHTHVVITFQRSYVPGQTTLCESCLARYEADPDALNVPRLGPVSHGWHRGTCDVKLAEWDAEMRAGLPFSDHTEVRP